MSASIRMDVGGVLLEGALYTTVSALKLLALLPIEIEMERWGDEYYGELRLPLGVALDPEARTEMQVGELAWWPPGNALCLFFGPTPASEGAEPRAASPVNPLGMVRGDLALLRALGPGVRARLARS